MPQPVDLLYDRQTYNQCSSVWHRDCNEWKILTVNIFIVIFMCCELPGLGQVHLVGKKGKDINVLNKNTQLFLQGNKGGYMNKVPLSVALG